MSLFVAMERKRYNRDGRCALPRTTKWRRTSIVDCEPASRDNVSEIECLPFAEELLKQYDDTSSTDFDAELLEPSSTCNDMLSDSPTQSLGGATSVVLTTSSEEGETSDELEDTSTSIDS